MKTRLIVAAAVLSLTSLLYAQKETIEGIRNFTKVDAQLSDA